MQTIGHNSVNEKLKRLVERIERLESEKHDLSEDVKTIYQEAKRDGFDTKVIRALIKRRKSDPDKLAEHEALLETYRVALGEFTNTPLGKAALESVA